MGPAVGSGVCVSLPRRRGESSPRKIKKWLAGPEASKPALWPRPGVEGCVCVWGGRFTERKIGRPVVGSADAGGRLQPPGPQ